MSFVFSIRVLIRHSGIRTTCQFNLKVFNHGAPLKHLWCSDPLNNYGFDEGQYCFYADDLAVELNSSGTSITIKSAVNENSIVNLTVTQAAPGFQVGKNGTSYFGTDPSHPWGSMRHAFWPRCDVEGTIVTKERKYDMRGRALFIHALQGMKPHHAGTPFLFPATHSCLMVCSCKMEFYQLSDANILGSDDGIHDSCLIW
jgi:Svf1-like N-terminal lipocalin domain